MRKVCLQKRLVECNQKNFNIEMQLVGSPVGTKGRFQRSTRQYRSFPMYMSVVFRLFCLFLSRREVQGLSNTTRGYGVWSITQIFMKSAFLTQS